MNTQGHSSNQLWVVARKRCITASNHQEVLTKINTIIHKKSIIKPKITPLIHELLNGSNLSNTDAIKWARDHVLNSFYIQKAMNEPCRL